MDEYTLFKTIADHSPAVIGAKDLDGRYIYVNEEYTRLFNLQRDEFIGKTDKELFPKEIADKFRGADMVVQESRKNLKIEETAPVQGNLRHFMTVKFPIFDDEGDLYATGVIATDITDRKRIEKEREELLTSLGDALGRVKILKGLLPICASCKKIRDAGGKWNNFDGYIEAHSEAEFTHSVCPECAKELYPDMVEEDGSA